MLLLRRYIAAQGWEHVAEPSARDNENDRQGRPALPVPVELACWTRRSVADRFLSPTV